MTPVRQIRAVFDDDTIIVFQAYSSAIASPAVAHNSFAATPFKLDRMTWIKPSFLWMMYRSGWGTKPGQERVLAVRVSRHGFEDALQRSALSHFDPSVYRDRAAWEERKRVSPVRVQWDPERSMTLEALQWRSLQVGLGGTASEDYVTRWTQSIEDVTDTVRSIHGHVLAGRTQVAQSMLPPERPYPLRHDLAMMIGAAPNSN